MVFFNSKDYTKKPSPATCLHNCLHDYAERSGGKILKISGTLNANNTSAIINLFKIIGTVEIIDAYGEISRVGTCNNLTNCFFDLSDGTNTVNITADGATLSGATVGTMVFKTLDSSNAATVVFSDECRLTEADTSKKTHHPFIVTQKNGADTFIRCHYTTTDAPIDLDIDFYIVYQSKNGGYAEAAS